MLKRLSALVFAVLMLAAVFPVRAMPETQEDLYVGDQYEYELWRGYNEGDDVKIIGGYLPAGLELAKIKFPNDGYTLFVVRGTATQMGVFNVHFQIQPAAGMYSDFIVVFLVMKRIEVESSTMPDGKVGEYYSRRIRTNYSEGEIDFTEFYNPGGPNQLGETGLTLDMDGNLTGTPKKAGTFKFWVHIETTLPGNVSDEFLIQITIRKEQTATPAPTAAPTAVPTAAPTVTQEPANAVLRPDCEFSADSIVYYDPAEQFSIELIRGMGQGCLLDLASVTLPEGVGLYIDGAGNRLMIESQFTEDMERAEFSFDIPITQDGRLFIFRYVFRPASETAPNEYPAGSQLAVGFGGN